MSSPLVLVSGSYTQLRNGTLNIDSLERFSTSGGITIGSDIILGSGLIDIGSSVTNYAAQIWLASSETTTHTSGPELAGYNIGEFGTNAGAYSIGVDASLLTSISDPAVTDLMSALVQLDAAIGGGGGGNQLMQAFVTDGAVVAGQIVAVSPTTDNRVVVADAADGLAGTIVGIALTSAGGAGVSINVALGGYVTGLSGLSRGYPYYLGSSSNGSAGDLVDIPPIANGDLIIRIGYADSATTLVIHVGEGTQL